MLPMSDRRLYSVNPLDYQKVVEEVERTNGTHTLVGWNNLCDVAFVGISRGDTTVSVKAVYELEQILAVLETFVGNKYLEVKRRIGETRDLLLKGENELTLYWLGQLRFVVTEIQKSVEELTQPYRKQLYDGVEASTGPIPRAEVVA